MNYNSRWQVWFRRVVVVCLILGVIIFYSIDSDHELRRLLPIGAAVVSGLYVALIFVDGIAALSDYRRTGFFSIRYGLLLGVCLFAAGTLLLNTADYFADFRLREESWSDVRIMLDWATKGALFDLVESFDLEASNYEAAHNKLLFDCFEFLFRLVWGAWTAYMLSSVFLHIRSRIWRRLLNRQRSSRDQV